MSLESDIFIYLTNLIIIIAPLFRLLEDGNVSHTARQQNFRPLKEIDLHKKESLLR